MERKPALKNKLVGVVNHPVSRLFSGLIGAVLTYIFILIAIDTGSLLDYTIAIVLACLALNEFRGALKGFGLTRKPR